MATLRIAVALRKNPMLQHLDRDLTVDKAGSKVCCLTIVGFEIKTWPFFASYEMFNVLGLRRNALCFDVIQMMPNAADTRVRRYTRLFDFDLWRPLKSFVFLC